MKSMVVCLGFLFFTSVIYSAENNISVDVKPSVIGTNDMAEITVSIVNESISDIPQLSENSSQFSLKYAGLSSQRQATVINGAMNMKTIHSYIFQYIPKLTGTITIPSFTIKTKNNTTLHSPTASITVEPKDSLKTTSQNTPRQFNPFAMLFDSPGEVFLRWSLSQNQLPQNTGFIASLYLYSENPNFLNAAITSLKEEVRPRFDGGVLHSIPLPKNNAIITRTVGFTTFYGKIIKSYVGFPLDKNELTLHTPILLLDQGPFSGYIQGEPEQIISKSINNKLSYIGDLLTLSSVLSNQKMKTAEEYTLTLTIQGNGNTDFFANPFQNISLPNVFISDATTKIDFELNPNNDRIINIKKTFTYQIIPRKPGTYVIPSVVLQYTTKQGKNKSISTPAIPFEVLGIISDQSKTIYTKFEEVNTPFIFSSGNISMIFSLLLGISMILSSYFYTKKRHKLSTNPTYARSSRAKKRLSRIIAEGEQAINQNHYKNAARLLRQSILYFCADTFSLSNSSSPQEIIDYFEKNNIIFDKKQEFLDLLAKLDFYAFGTPPTESEIFQHLNMSYKILESLDKIKKNTKKP